MPPQRFPVLTALITHCIASLPSVAGRCTTVPYQRAGLDGLEADSAAAVADEDDLLAVQRLLRPGRALVGADDEVDVRAGPGASSARPSALAPACRRSRPRRRPLSRAALVTASKPLRIADVERRDLHGVEVADLHGLSFFALQACTTSAPCFLPDLGLHEDDVAREPGTCGFAGRRVRARGSGPCSRP